MKNSLNRKTRTLFMYVCAASCDDIKSISTSIIEKSLMAEEG